MLEGEGEEECVGQKLKFNAMFTAGTVSVPLSMMFWGRLIDLKGVKWVRLVSLSLFTVGCVLFAESGGGGEGATMGVAEGEEECVGQHL